MSARILDGKRIADALLDDLAVRVEARVAAGKPRPGLAVVLVGGDPASAVYVRNKRKAGKKVGIHAYDHDLPADTTEAQLGVLIDQLNADPKVHGILVQLPLPGIPDAAPDQRIEPTQGRRRFPSRERRASGLAQFGRALPPRGITTGSPNTDRCAATTAGDSRGQNTRRPMALELIIAGCTTSHATVHAVEVWKRRYDRPTSSRGGGKANWCRASGSSRRHVIDSAKPHGRWRLVATSASRPIGGASGLPGRTVESTEDVASGCRTPAAPKPEAR